MNIGFIGTGLLGYPMAERLLKSHHHLIAWNRTIEKAVPLKEQGGRIAESPTQIYKSDVEVIVFMLTDFLAITEVLSSCESLKGKIVFQMGTIAPDENIQVQKKVEELGGSFLEAPVLGSKNEAREGKLNVMVGGNKDLFERYSAVLSVWGNVKYIGGVGKASTLKLAFNQIIAGIMTTFSVSVGIVEKSDIPLDLFVSILRGSALHAQTFDKKLEKMTSKDFSNPNFPVKHLLKDVNLIKEETNKLGIDSRSVSAVQDILQDSVRQGLGELDYSALFLEILNNNLKK
eukprot:TRINITY_DN5616_c0_g1_i1.p1 TRINITY_DN5616_c0_g1~~TRINITY_DN5616_c0_g1_i1.p1  ORF type:complete len:288 (+),score=57.93 TRINITY_DN5616_c0_g1_i1:137-1000(+)